MRGVHGPETLCALLADYPPSHRGSAGAAGVRIVLHVYGVSWGIPDADLATLLDLDAATLAAWRAHQPTDAAAYSNERLARLTYLLGIVKLLSMLDHANDTMDVWVRTPNAAPLFQQQPPLVLMRHGLDGLATVTQHLDALVRRGARHRP